MRNLKSRKVCLKILARSVLRASAILPVLVLRAGAGAPAKPPPVQVGNVFPHVTT